MAGQSFDTFFKALRGGRIPGAIYLHGAEDVLKEEAVDLIIEKAVDPSVRDFNLDRRSAATLDPEAAETLCNTLPMMADRRVVIISGVEAWNKRARAKAAVLRYLERPAAETILVLVQGPGDSVDKDLAGKTVAVAADPLPADRAVRWVEHHATRIGVTLEPAAADHLVAATGGSLGDLRMELDKLAGLAGEGPLTRDRVASLLGIRHGETKQDWIDAVLAGRVGRAVEMLPHVLAQKDASGVSLVTMLGTAVIGVGIAASHAGRGLRGGQLEKAIRDALMRNRAFGMNYGRAAAEWARVAPDWPVARVVRGLAACRRADERLKNTTLGDDRAILFDLVMELNLPWQHAA